MRFYNTHSEKRSIKWEKIHLKQNPYIPASKYLFSNSYQMENYMIINIRTHKKSSIKRSFEQFHEKDKISCR